MKRLFAFIMILVFLLAIGCAKKADIAEEQPAPAPVKPAPAQPPAPKLTPVEPEKEEEVKPPKTKTAEAEGGLGTNVEGTKKEAVEEDVPEEQIEIMLNKDKTMSRTELTVDAGTTVYWKNYDTWPHQLAVETGKGFDTKRHAESTRLLEKEVWEYTFNDKGTFLVRDIFSGKMRMNVTVE
jgi:plastocyanin